MSKKSKSKSSSSATAARHSLTIRSKVMLNRILEATSNSVKIEINEEGSITGRYTGIQEVTKICLLSGPCSGVTFSITVTGNNPVTPSSFTLQNGQTQDVTLGPGSFTVHEAPMPGFIRSSEGDCKQMPGSSDATGTISAGQTLHCAILNGIT
jgi:hypothetical protein